MEMKDESDNRGESHREIIGTLKFAGWIALFVLAIFGVLLLLGE